MLRKKVKNCESMSTSNGVPSLPGTSPTNPEAQNKSVEELMSEVFSIDMLREMIVGQVIKNEMGRGPSRNDLRAVRLVAKSWHKDSSIYLLATGQALHKIKLKSDNSLNSSPLVQQTGGKHLDKFTSAMASTTNLHVKLPPFSLTIFSDFFREENYLSFSNFLKGCASGLVELTMLIPWKGGSMTFLFPDLHFAFPHLHTLILCFPKYILTLEEEDMPFSFGSNAATLPFIQSILQGSPKLKIFRIMPNDGGESCAPLGIRRLLLPATITKLDVRGFDTNSQFECLLHFNLPNLVNLTLGISNVSYAEGLVSQILEKFRASLKRLAIVGKPGLPDSPNPSTLFRFPRMEKLNWLVVTSHVGLEDGHEPLQHSLPNLDQLRVHLTGAEISKWTEFSSFPNVTELVLSITDRERWQIDVPHFSVSFPNLNTLRLDFKLGADFAFLRRIFLEKRELKTLIICDNSKVTNANEWDSLFTGIPVETLAANPGFCRRIKSLEEDNQQPSISLLRDLQKLSLSSTSTGQSIISDIAFQQGFMLIKNLRQLSLKGRFKASPEMIQAWGEDGRKIVSP